MQAMRSKYCQLQITISTTKSSMAGHGIRGLIPMRVQKQTRDVELLAGEWVEVLLDSLGSDIIQSTLFSSLFVLLSLVKVPDLSSGLVRADNMNPGFRAHGAVLSITIVGRTCCPFFVKTECAPSKLVPPHLFRGESLP
ncbi:hypothetical protein HG531_006050 [Fusarium graminearum]|nr:hypothetical protein HG531_006050 [Fusarium graminearum]